MTQGYAEQQVAIFGAMAEVERKTREEERDLRERCVDKVLTVGNFDGYGGPNSVIKNAEILANYIENGLPPIDVPTPQQPAECPNVGFLNDQD